MGWTGGSCFGLIARIGVLAFAAAALAACAAADKVATKETASRRVADVGEPISKGRGNYKIGQPYQQNGKTYYPSEDLNYRAEGIASWYGPDFHGRRTANGEIYDMHGISAAHPTLPMPSYLRVTHLGNGRSIIVRLNNRGPFAHNRIIDLSVGTAKALDFYGHGLARVRVEYMGRAPLEGGNDRMLLATLREGGPAPAPSQVMMASATPAPSLSGGVTARARDGATAMRTERSITPGTPGGELVRPAAAPGGELVRPAAAASAEPKAQSVVRSPVISNRVSATAPTPVQNLGLVNGRGLY